MLGGLLRPEQVLEAQPRLHPEAPGRKLFKIAPRLVHFPIPVIARVSEDGEAWPDKGDSSNAPHNGRASSGDERDASAGLQDLPGRFQQVASLEDDRGVVADEDAVDGASRQSLRVGAVHHLHVRPAGAPHLLLRSIAEMSVVLHCEHEAAGTDRTDQAAQVESWPARHVTYTGSWPELQKIDRALLVTR